MALNNLDPKIVNKLFLARMVEYVHSGELERDYDEAKKAEANFGHIVDKVTQVVEEHQEELQKAAPDAGIQPPAANIQAPAANIQTPAANIQAPAANIQTPAANTKPSVTKAAYLKNFHATGGISNPANCADDDTLPWTDREILRIFREAHEDTARWSYEMNKENGWLARERAKRLQCSKTPE
ncbi:hypothetical protein LTR17_020106 [Elasticomyces elasticus]|nr:hypothetical protein LTR17_020106 [Elasticomyces elasticus]